MASDKIHLLEEYKQSPLKCSFDYFYQNYSNSGKACGNINIVNISDILYNYTLGRYTYKCSNCGLTNIIHKKDIPYHIEIAIYNESFCIIL